MTEFVFCISITENRPSDDWLKCDDDKLSIVKEEDVLKLSGGGQYNPDIPPF